MAIGKGPTKSTATVSNGTDTFFFPDHLSFTVTTTIDSEASITGLHKVSNILVNARPGEPLTYHIPHASDSYMRRFIMGQCQDVKPKTFRNYNSINWEIICSVVERQLATKTILNTTRLSFQYL